MIRPGIPPHLDLQGSLTDYLCSQIRAELSAAGTGELECSGAVDGLVVRKLMGPAEASRLVHWLALSDGRPPPARPAAARKPKPEPEQATPAQPEPEQATPAQPEPEKATPAQQSQDVAEAARRERAERL